MSIREALRAPSRRVRPAGTLALASAVQIQLTAEDVLSFTVQEGADSALLPGSVLSASCALTLNNMDGRWLPGGARLGSHNLMGATLSLALEALDGDAWRRAPVGVFLIDRISAPEQRPSVRISGVDSIGTELAGLFRDGMSYPCTLADLWRHAVSQTRYGFSGAVPNGQAIIDAPPDWKEASLRAALGYIAAAAGCFVRADREGALALEPCRRAGVDAEIGPDAYMTLTREPDTFGPVDALQVTPIGSKEAFTVWAGEAGSAGATLSVARNPLFMAGAAHLTDLARGMLGQLAGMALSRAEFRWRGDPAVSAGSLVRLTDTRGAARTLAVTRQTMTFNRGFSAVCACETPSADTSGRLRAITPEGGVNADALVGTVDGGLLAAGSVTASAIRAGAVTAAKLDAGAVTAEKLAAGAVTAEKIAAGVVSAEAVEAVRARLAGITAQTVSTDALAAAFASFARVVAGDIQARRLEADQLAAAMADIVALTAKTGQFDFATAQNLLSNAMILQRGYADSVLIANLAVTSANLLDATVGHLVLKGDDGEYYEINIGGDGAVSTKRVEVSASEISAGRLDDGRQIVRETVNARSINGQSVKASEAILNAVLTAALTAGQITANEAMIASASIPALYTTSLKSLGDSLDISANERITFLIAQDADIRAAADSKRRVFTGQPAPPYDVGDLWAQGSGGDILRCRTKRTTGNYSAADWVPAGKYTDDTAAIVAQIDANAARNAAGTAQATADAAEETAAGVRRWMTFDEDGLHQGRDGSTYSTLVDEEGFHVLQLGEKIGSFAKRRLAAEELRVGSVTTAQTRCVLREAGDGGLIITVEGLT